MQYLETSILSKKFRTGIQITPLQKSYELPASVQSYAVEFTYAVEISIVFDKSNKHSTIYDSYNAEVASTLIQNVSIENVGNTYSVANELKYDTNDATEKYMLSKQFAVRSCNGCFIAPLTDYANNPIYQELPMESKYFTNVNKRIEIH